jgi:hypothetical protein
MATGGQRAPLDLAAAHSGRKRGGGGRSRATDGEVVMVAGGSALRDLSGRQLQRRKGQQGSHNTDTPRGSKIGTSGSPESTNLRRQGSVPLFTKMGENGNGVGSVACQGFGVAEKPHDACAQPFQVLVGARAVMFPPSKRTAGPNQDHYGVSLSK